MTKSKFLKVFAVCSLGVSLISTGIVIANANKIADKTNASAGTYYDSVDTSSAANLYSTLVTLEAKGGTGSYDGLWTVYTTAYKKSNGYIKDYYSDSTTFTPTTDKCGSYSVEGDCYNREHSIPKSWWGGATTNQGADPFIVIPTDGKVNGMRSNYALGEVTGTPSYTSNSGCKLGSGVIGSASQDKVFEPMDSVKGDLARIYFYSRVRWPNVSMTTGEGSTVFSGSQSTNYGLTDDAVELFLKWSDADPVDDWEMSVNDAIYSNSTYGNRNPFVDHPEWITTLWGGTAPTSLTMSPTSATVNEGETVQLTVTADQGSSACTWASNNTSVATVSSSGLVTAVGSGTATITATSSIDTSISCTATITVNALSSISISGTATKRTYDAGDSFDPTGLTVTATYTNGTTATVDNSSCTWTPDPLTEGTTEVTCTYGSKTATYSGITVKASSFVNTIKECYSKTSGTTVTDVYGTFVGGINGNASSIIMNDDYGIMLYLKAPDSSWVENETVLHVTTSTLSVYKNLYELASVSVETVTDQTTIDTYVRPTKIYQVTGSETSSDTTLANRLSYVTGKLASLSNTGTWSASADVTGTMTVGSNTVNIFIKKTDATADLGTKLNGYLTSGEEISLKGFTSIYSTSFQVAYKELITISTDYTADDFASDFISQTASICAASESAGWSDVSSQLSPVWVTLQGSDYYAKLSSTEKAKLTAASASASGSTLEQAMARYDHIVMRYELTNFINRTISSGSNRMNIVNNPQSMVAVFAVIAIASFSLGVVLFTIKRKHE